MNCVEEEIHSLTECPLCTHDRLVFFEDIAKNNNNFLSLTDKEK
jgi:hypothetical protein